MGFDPMVNLAHPADVVTALELATHGSGEGVFNVPGFDTLPLSEAARLLGTPAIPAPEWFIRPAYALRHKVVGSEFAYGIQRSQLHLGLVLDGTRGGGGAGLPADAPGGVAAPPPVVSLGPGPVRRGRAGAGRPRGWRGG